MTVIQLNKTHKQILKAVNDFVKGEFKKEVVDEIIENYTFPENIWKKACEIGLIGMHYPEEYSGQGLGAFENALMTQFICRGDSSVGSCLCLAGYGAELILRFGTQHQKEKWLLPVAEGEMLSSLALTEPNLGSDIDQCQTTAEKKDNHYIISGTKTFALNAGPLAGFYIVFAKTENDADAKNAFSTILVESDRDGIELQDVGSRLGRRLMHVGLVKFDKVRVPFDNLVGKENNGLAQINAFMNEARINSAAQVLGIAQGAYDRALAHVKQREQFGRKIVDFQITRQKLAEMATKIEAAKLLIYQAAWQFDNEKRPGSRPGAMAKLYASQAAFEVCDEALQMFGGYGYMQEYEIERFYRDVKMADLFDGTKRTQKNIISDELVKARSI